MDAILKKNSRRHAVYEDITNWISTFRFWNYLCHLLSFASVKKTLLQNYGVDLQISCILKLFQIQLSIKFETSVAISIRAHVQSFKYLPPLVHVTIIVKMISTDEKEHVWDNLTYRKSLKSYF